MKQIFDRITRWQDTAPWLPNFPAILFECSLLWRHNGNDSVSNHQPYDCLLNRLFRRRSKKTSKLRVADLCVGNSPGPVNSPHKWPVTRKCFHLMTSSGLFMKSSCELLSGDRAQILRDATNESLNTHNIFIDSECNDGYLGSCGKFSVRY